jgi:hypothetical protein
MVVPRCARTDRCGDASAAGCLIVRSVDLVQEILSNDVDARMHPLYCKRSLTLANLPVVACDDAVHEALRSDKTSQRIFAKGLSPAAGDIIGVRLNLNIFRSKKVTVQTIHGWNGNDGYKSNRGLHAHHVIDYQNIVRLQHAYFNVDQVAREKIAAGRDSKSPMGSIDGVYFPHLPGESPDFDGVEIGFNPHKTHLFMDADGNPIRYAEEVTIYGHRAYARGALTFYTTVTAPARRGDAPSAVRFSDLNSMLKNSIMRDHDEHFSVA